VSRSRLNRKPCTTVQGQAVSFRIAKIGELANSCDVPTQTIRFYEKRGLLPEPTRLPNGYRSYDHATVERITFIRRSQAAGLTLAEIAGVLNVRDEGQAPCSHVSDLLATKLGDVQQRIERTHRAP
jgi:DNA-binding transcriptional MerR regulator